MNTDKEPREGKAKDGGCRGGGEGEGAAGGPCERRGCDFNTRSSQSHYRLQSEERRGQT